MPAQGYINVSSLLAMLFGAKPHPVSPKIFFCLSINSFQVPSAYVGGGK